MKEHPTLAKFRRDGNIMMVGAGLGIFSTLFFSLRDNWLCLPSFFFIIVWTFYWLNKKYY